MPTQDKLIFVARKLGWKWHTSNSGPYDGYWISPCGTQSESRPDLEHSVDALLAKGGPVEWLVNQKSDVSIIKRSWDNHWQVEILTKVYAPAVRVFSVKNLDLASALFEACYKVMGGTDGIT